MFVNVQVYFSIISAAHYCVNCESPGSVARDVLNISRVYAMLILFK